MPHRCHYEWDDSAEVERCIYCGTPKSTVRARKTVHSGGNE